MKSKLEGFPKAQRLLRRRDFRGVQDLGSRASVGVLVGLARRNAAATTRVGLTVSSKVGNAVVRNRIRRRLRELCRKSRALLPAGTDIVLIARPGAAHEAFSGLSRDFVALAAKLSEHWR